MAGIRRNYSRLARVEEARNLRTAFLFGTLTIAILIAFVFLGLPTVAKFAGFLSDLGSSNKPIEKNDTVPPPPPDLEDVPEFTNQKQVTLVGTTESASTAKIYVNGQPNESVADNDGRFKISITLRDGENTVYGTSTDLSGNTSGHSPELIIVLDEKAPDLELNNLSDGAAFSGDQKELTIEGKTEAEANLTINDRVVLVNEDGSFKTEFTLSEGENQINFKVSDKAQNSKELGILVTYTP